MITRYPLKSHFHIRIRSLYSHSLLNSMLRFRPLFPNFSHFSWFLKRRQLSCIQAVLKGPLLPVRWGRTSEVSARSHASTAGPPTTGRQRGHLFPHRGLASIWNLSINPRPFRARRAKRAPAVWRDQETRGEDEEAEAYSSMNLLWFARTQYLNTPTLAIEKPLSGMSPLLSLYFFFFY